jgi:hypothetical protein
MFCRKAQSSGRSTIVLLISTVPTNTPVSSVLIRTLAINQCKNRKEVKRHKPLPILQKE